jgi:hypothetical protein
LNSHHHNPIYCTYNHCATTAFLFGREWSISTPTLHIQVIFNYLRISCIYLRISCILEHSVTVTRGKHHLYCNSQPHAVTIDCTNAPGSRTRSQGPLPKVKQPKQAQKAKSKATAKHTAHKKAASDESENDHGDGNENGEGDGPTISKGPQTKPKVAAKRHGKKTATRPDDANENQDANENEDASENETASDDDDEKGINRKKGTGARVKGGGSAGKRNTKYIGFFSSFSSLTI